MPTTAITNKKIAAELEAVCNESAALAKTSIAMALPASVGLAIAGFGLLVLFGWAFEIGPLKSVFSNFETMKPATAVAFILSGVLLYLRSDRREGGAPAGLQTILGLIVLVIGTLTLVQFYLGMNLWIGDALIAKGWSVDATRPMSVPSALLFVLFGMAMLLPKGGRRADVAFVSATMLGTAIALLVFAGYLYSLRILYEPVAASSIALHTAITAFIFFSARR